MRDNLPHPFPLPRERGYSLNASLLDSRGDCNSRRRNKERTALSSLPLPGERDGVRVNVSHSCDAARITPQRDAWFRKLTRYNFIAMTSPAPLFSTIKPVIAMIHLGALPGTPANGLSLVQIEKQALHEAKTFHGAGIHGLMLENMHDAPYLRAHVGPEIVAAMAIIARAVKQTSKLPCGVQVLAGANLEAMAVAHAAGLDFIRAEGFAFAHVADEGIIQSSAAELLRYRRAIGAESIQVWADAKKKHSSHAITADVDIGETAHAIEFMRGDAVIVTGAVTGDAPQRSDVLAVKQKTRLPVYLGSGVTANNLKSFFSVADGFITGSEFKQGGHWSRAVDARRVEKFMTAHSKLS